MFRPVNKVITAILFGGMLAACNLNGQEAARVKDTVTPTVVAPSHTPTDLPTEAPSPLPSITPSPTPVPPQVCQGENGKPFYMEFPPIDGTEKIAYSGDGLTLLDPPSSQIARIHSLSSEGLKGWDTGIRWSPDGSRIVFLYSEKGRQPNPEVIVLIADLTVGRICTLISEPGRYSTPAWSPDGNQIVLTDPSTGGLIIVNIYNRTTTVLENDVQEGTSAQWISDQAILYVRKNQEGKNDLVLRSMDGSPSSAIVQNVNGLRDFLMSPDRQYLTYYASGLTLNNTIRKEEVKIGDMLPVAWSNDGQMLFAKAGLSGIYLLKSQDNFTELPIPVWGFIGRQSLSQDNRFLALEIAGDGTKLSQLGILELATNELRIIDLPDLYPSDPAWNPKME